MSEVPGKKWWRRSPMSASGIVRVRTGFMPKMSRTPRRKLPRPSLAVNLALLGLAAVLASTAALHRKSLDGRLGPFLSEPDVAPFEIRRIRQDLADQQLDEKTLDSELRARLDYARVQKSKEFYLVVDTSRKRLAFKYGDKILRDAPVQVGPPRVIPAKAGKGWTFPAVAAGLGKYVLVFAGSYVIHSPPPPDSPLKTVKPASFMVPEADLAAIWRRVGPGTRVYVF
jgi:hypothetical protein